MFINIRGTQGAGKTTAAKILYQEFAERKRLIHNKKRHWMTLCKDAKDLNTTVFVGQYKDTDPYTVDLKFLSGADQLQYTTQLYTLAKFCRKHNYDMLWECSLLQSPVVYSELAKLDNVLVLWLNRDQATIAQQRRKRSEIKGTTHLVERENPIITADSLKRDADRIKQISGVTLVETTHDKVLDTVKQHTVLLDSVDYTSAALWDTECELMFDTSLKNTNKQLPNIFEEV